MKKIYILSLLLISIFTSNAQNQPRGFHLDKPIDMRAILAKKPLVGIGFSSVSEARSIINDIMDVSDIQQNFKVEATTQVDNAAAVIYQNVRYILYNPSFINDLDNAAQDKWASISVIGHEIGHHLLGHTLDGRGSQIPKELEADEFSGLVLRRMGATLQQAQLAMKLIASPYASATHPGENDRLAAIAKGWNSTSVKTNRGNSDVAINTPGDERGYPNSNPQTYPNTGNSYPAPTDKSSYPSSRDRRNYPPETNENYPSPNYPADRGGNYPSNRRDYPSTTDGRQNYPGSNNGNYGQRSGSQGNGRWRGNGASNLDIMYDIRFNTNNPQQYFITSQNQVVMISRNQAVVVAKIASTNASNYPYVIYDDRQEILMDRSGNLFSENGRRIGYVSRHN